MTGPEFFSAVFEASFMGMCSGFVIGAVSSWVSAVFQ
jgi:hypothetical protein